MSGELNVSQKQEYDSFFSSIKIISDFTEKTEERLASKLAPKFNYFDLFGPNENKISAILCDLLNVNGRHGQGEIFLTKFLETIGLEGFLPLRNVSTITEALTIDGRRVDLLISTDKWIIGIENKPWASDQNNQLIDYYKHVGKKASKKKNYAIVYLSGRDTAPSDLTQEKIKHNSTEKSKFIMMRYCGSGFVHKGKPVFPDYTVSGSLISWLTQCIKHCESSHVTIFLQHFYDYINVHFSNNGEGSMSESKKNIISYIKEDPRRVKLALNIDQKSLKKEIVDNFLEKLKTSFQDKYTQENNGKHLECNDILTGNFFNRVEGCPRLQFYVSEWPKYTGDEEEKYLADITDRPAITLCLETSGKGGSFYWGLRSYKNWLSAQQQEELIKLMNEKLGEKTKRTDWWPWMKKDEPWAKFRENNTLVKLASKESDNFIENSDNFIENIVEDWMATIGVVNEFVKENF